MVPETVIVKNALGDEDSIATVLVRNKLDVVPDISVIVPVYNTEQYVVESIRSITEQSHKNIEIICVDDGSSDNTLELLIQLARSDNRITIVRQENLHAGVARNCGLCIARGKYIHFMDSDDLMYCRDTYKNILDVLAQYNWPDVLNCAATAFDNDNVGHLYDYITCDDNVVSIYDDFDAWAMVSVVCWAKFIKREFIMNNDIRFNNTFVCNDRYFWAVCSLVANKIFCTSQPVVKYRVNRKTSLVGNRAKHFDDMFRSIDKIRDYLEYRQSPPPYCAAFNLS